MDEHDFQSICDSFDVVRKFVFLVKTRDRIPSVITCYVAILNVDNSKTKSTFYKYQK